MKILITGAAGFVGSHLSEYLLRDPNHYIVGIDKLTNNYEPEIKNRNLSYLVNHPRFQCLPVDLATDELKPILQEIDVVYHLAGMPGVRSSWGNEFTEYVQNNILATQRLLEASKGLPIKKFIYISTSSVYGEKHGKVSEDLKPDPLSPYGITKLTGEYLCHAYHKSWQIPIAILRYFTVYGPRQRPDMAFHIFIKQMLENQPITINGDGKQSRDFTYIEDCVKGTAAVLDCDACIGKTMNIGGKENATILEVISIMEELVGKKATLQFGPDAKGEPKHTWADISTAQQLLGYNPSTSLKEGLKHELDDLLKLYNLKLP
ncbi:NAD-dependent epimerase/dehydratase family protein [Pseudalkalibacillus sp. Hm43]|uniref:NAD-dependent epimerase/dehydratase family protein n=1 Tax=Pseudalkalibacillus sp. Hm43 TaxID=3450742 RepID=UPI003F422EC6